MAVEGASTNSASTASSPKAAILLRRGNRWRRNPDAGAVVRRADEFDPGGF
jgi:hypothetical protein